jgi:hypothetical protein
VTVIAQSYSTPHLTELEKDADWRRSEIIYLRKQEALTRFDGPGTVGAHRNEIYLRLLVSTMYAHHEGFSIKCWEAIYESLDSAPLSPMDLIPELQLLMLEGEFKKLRSCTSRDLLTALNNIKLLFPTGYQFVKSQPVVSNGNLKPKPYREAFELLGITITLTRSEEQDLYRLVDFRNDVAHGRPLIRSKVEGKLDDFADLVYALQDRAFLLTKGFIEDKKYLVPSAR